MMINLDKLKSAMYGLHDSRTVRATATVDGEHLVFDVVGACAGPGPGLFTLALVESIGPPTKADTWKQIMECARTLDRPDDAEVHGDAVRRMRKALDAWKDAV